MNSHLEQVERRAHGKAIVFPSEGRSETLIVDEILVATGRAPNVAELGLETVGVEYDPRDGVRVNDFLRTTNPRIYAAGDVCLKWKFTHAAAAARIVIQNALFAGWKRASRLIVPWCTYTDPEIAHVGLSEHEAREREISIRTFAHVDRAVVDGDTEGFVKMHVREGMDRILGATIVARHAGEMINELTMAMKHGIGLGAIASVIHPYPTQAEAIRQLGDAYHRTRLSPLVKKLLGLWLKMGR